MVRSSAETIIIFDVFETLAYNNPHLWVRAFGKICHIQGLDVDPGVLWREWRTFDGAFRRTRLNLEAPEKSPPFKTYQQAWRESFRDAFAKLGLTGDPVAAAEYMVGDMAQREFYQDALEALPTIQKRWKTAILSNADDYYLLPLLERLGLRFEAVVSSEMARAYKPVASPFKEVLRRLDASPEQAIYVGDNQLDDVMGARGVDMRAVWVNRNGVSLDPKLPGPDYQVRSLLELPQILGG